MPYKSQAQRRKFFAMESRGELPKGTAREWAHHTPNIKSLPERVKKKKGKSKATAKKRKRASHELRSLILAEPVLPTHVSPSALFQKTAAPAGVQSVLQDLPAAGQTSVAQLSSRDQPERAVSTQPIPATFNQRKQAQVLDYAKLAFNRRLAAFLPFRLKTGVLVSSGQGSFDFVSADSSPDIRNHPVQQKQPENSTQTTKQADTAASVAAGTGIGSGLGLLSAYLLAKHLYPPTQVPSTGNPGVMVPDNTAFKDNVGQLAQVGTLMGGGIGGLSGLSFGKYRARRKKKQEAAKNTVKVAGFRHLIKLAGEPVPGSVKSVSQEGQGNLLSRIGQGMKKMWTSPEPSPGGLPGYNSAVYNALTARPGGLAGYPHPGVTSNQAARNAVNTRRAALANQAGRPQYMRDTSYETSRLDDTPGFASSSLHRDPVSGLHVEQAYTEPVNTASVAGLTDQLRMRIGPGGRTDPGLSVGYGRPRLVVPRVDPPPGWNNPGGHKIAPGMDEILSLPPPRTVKSSALVPGARMPSIPGLRQPPQPPAPSLAAAQAAMQQIAPIPTGPPAGAGPRVLGAGVAPGSAGSAGAQNGLPGHAAINSVIQTKGPISASGDFGNPNAGQGVKKMGSEKLASPALAKILRGLMLMRAGAAAGRTPLNRRQFLGMAGSEAAMHLTQPNTRSALTRLGRMAPAGVSLAGAHATNPGLLGIAPQLRGKWRLAAAGGGAVGVAGLGQAVHQLASSSTAPPRQNSLPTPGAPAARLLKTGALLAAVTS